MIIELDIDCTKIDKARLHKDKYLRATCVEIAQEKKQKWDDGNIKHDGFIAHKVSKEERERGERGAIIGNFRIVRPKDSPARAASHASDGGAWG